MTPLAYHRQRLQDREHRIALERYRQRRNAERRFERWYKFRLVEG